MKKALPAILLLLAVAVLILDSVFNPNPNSTPAKQDRNEATNQVPDAIQSAWAGSNQFRATLDRTKSEVLDGSLPLEEASRLLACEAKRHNANLLRTLEADYPGLNPQELMANLLMRHFSAYEQQGYLSAAQKGRFSQLRDEHKIARERLREVQPCGVSRGQERKTTDKRA